MQSADEFQPRCKVAVYIYVNGVPAFNTQTPHIWHGVFATRLCSGQGHMLQSTFFEVATSCGMTCSHNMLHLHFRGNLLCILLLMWIFSATYIYSSCGTLNRATIIISFCGMDLCYNTQHFSCAKPWLQYIHLSIMKLWTLTTSSNFSWKQDIPSIYQVLPNAYQKYASFT